MKKQSIRLLAWLQGPGAGELRLGERVRGGWRVSPPLNEFEIVDALQALGAGEAPGFDGAVVCGVLGAADITSYAPWLVEALATRQAAQEQSDDGVRLVWNEHEHRLTEPCEGGWRLSAPLGDQALWSAMRALAAGRRPKFASKVVVAGLIGWDDITDGAAKALDANGM